MSGKESYSDKISRLALNYRAASEDGDYHNVSPKARRPVLDALYAAADEAGVAHDSAVGDMFNKLDAQRRNWRH